MKGLVVIAVITVVTAFVVRVGSWRQTGAGISSDMQDEGIGGWYRSKRGRVYAGLQGRAFPNP